MPTDTVAIEVPQPLYRRLERLAALAGQPMDRLIDRALSASLPPLPEDLPPAMQESLLALERLSDEELTEVVHGRMPEDDAELFADLRERRADGQLSAQEQSHLDRLMQAADLLTLRKAYAAVLLRWRGARVPTLAELES